MEGKEFLKKGITRKADLDAAESVTQTTKRDGGLASIVRMEANIRAGFKASLMCVRPCCGSNGAATATAKGALRFSMIFLSLT